MKIIGHVPFVDGPVGGGDISFLETCRYFADAGHEVKILVGSGTSRYEGNIEIIASPAPRQVIKLYRKADAIFIQRRDALQPLMELNAIERMEKERSKRPLRVYFARNADQPNRYGYTAEIIDLVVFNAGWTQRDTDWIGNSTVFFPPVFAEKYRTTPGDKIVQVNLAPKKGGDFFWRLVRRLPHRQFLAVMGKERQLIPDVVPPNCEILENTPNIRDDVYAQAKLILMPSQGVAPSEKWVKRGQAGWSWTESWGRVPIEAAASGIPSIVFPTPGLKESVGNSGLFLPFDEQMWVDEINRLYDDEGYYRERSQRALARSAELDASITFPLLEKRIKSAIAKNNKITVTAAPFKHLSLTPDLGKAALRSLRTKVKGGDTLRSLRALKSFVSKLGQGEPQKTKKAKHAEVFDNGAANDPLNPMQLLGSPVRTTVLFGARKGRWYMDCSSVMFEHFLETRPDIEAIWVTRSEEVRQTLTDAGRPVVKIGTSAWRSAMRRASVAMISSQMFDITDNAESVPEHLKFIFLGHGKSLKATNLANLLDKSAKSIEAATELGDRVSIAVATSPYVASIASRCYGIEEGKYRMTGHPRNDEMLSVSEDAKADWREFIGDSEAAGRIILYAPTWRQGDQSTRLFPYSDFDEAVLARELEESQSTMLLRLHPRDLRKGSEANEDVARLLAASPRIRVCSSDDISNINPFLGFVDVLMTDYSSIWQDFILLDRPVILLPYDYEEFSTTQGFVDDYFANLPGPAVYSMTEFYDVLSKCLTGGDPYAKQRNEIRMKFHTHSDANSVARVSEQFDLLMSVQ